MFARRLLDYEALIVAAAVAATLVDARWLPLAVGVGLAFWPLRWLVTRRLSLRTPVDLGVAGLLIMLPVTLWVTPYPEETRSQVLRLLSGVLLFYSLVNGLAGATPPDRTGRLRWGARGLALLGAGLAVFALVSVRWNEYKLPFIPDRLVTLLPRLVSNDVHPNVMGGALVILLALVLGLLLFAWQAQGRLENAGLLLAAVSMLLVLVLTKSRGAWVGLAAALAVLVALRWRWGWLASGLGAVGLGLWVGSLGWGAFLEMLTANEAIRGLDGRLEIWSRGLYMLRDFPFTGVGLGSYGPVADRLYPFFLEPPASVPHAHNLFLQVAVDLGLPGLLAWLVVFGGVIACAWRVWRYGRRQENYLAGQGERWAWGLGAGLLASQAALAVHGLTDAAVWGMVRSAPLVWALWGLACAAGRVYPQDASRPSEAL